MRGAGDPNSAWFSIWAVAAAPGVSVRATPAGGGPELTLFGEAAADEAAGGAVEEVRPGETPFTATAAPFVEPPRWASSASASGWRT